MFIGIITQSMSGTTFRIQRKDTENDVEVFITITEVNAAVTGYTDEKKTQYMASLLVEGPALYIHVRLDDQKRKDLEELRSALRNEFEAAIRDREVALKTSPTESC